MASGAHVACATARTPKGANDILSAQHHMLDGLVMANHAGIKGSLPYAHKWQAGAMHNHGEGREHPCDLLRRPPKLSV